MDDGRADQHGLRHAVAEQAAPGAADRPRRRLERIGEGVAISRKSSIRTPWWRTSRRRAALLARSTLPSRSTVEQGGGGVVEHRLVEAVGVDQLVALVAQPLDRLVERRGRARQSRCPGQGAGEALAEIAEPDGVDEPGKFQIRPLDMAPRAGPRRRRGGGRRPASSRRDRAGRAKRRTRRQRAPAAPAARPGRR